MVEYRKKVLPTFGNIFHVFLTRGLQKYAKQFIPTMFFGNRTRQGKKLLRNGLDQAGLLIGDDIDSVLSSMAVCFDFAQPT